MAIEVRIERARCIGSRTCVNRAPEIFRLDESNIAVVTAPEAGIDESRTDDMVAAAEDCPTLAISVVKDGEQLS